MLQSIRDHTQGWIAGVIVSLLILSFALWGIHSYLEAGSASPVVAKVNGVEITKGQLAVAYERLRRQLQMQFNSSYQLPEQAEAKLKDQALQTLINIQVLVQASLGQNYRISSPQVDNFLESMPEFQINGRFSMSRFQQLLETTLYSAGDFLDLIKTSLLIDQPRLGLILTSFALPDEINQTIALVNQERNISYAVLNKDSILKQSINISQEKMNAYYQQHEEEFKTPEQVSIEYIELTLKDLMTGVNPTDEVLKQFYSENSTSYEVKGSGVQPFEKVKNKVLDSYIRQQAEEKFAELREKLANVTYEHPDSLEFAAKTLGLKINTSDMFSKDKSEKGIASHPKIREAAFSNDVLNLQNNSEVIQTGPDSAVVIRVKTHVPAALLPLEAVKDQITEKLKVAEINAQLAQLANEIKQKLRANENPSLITQQYHLTWTPLNFIGRHSNKIDPAILNTAFAMPKPQANKLIFDTAKVANGYAIISLKAVREGVFTGKNDQYKIFAEQVQNTQGLMEYELYKQSLIKRAKIVIGS